MYSYNIGKILALPDIICTMPKGKCVYIKQSTSICAISNMLHFQHSKNLLKLDVIFQPLYIVTRSRCDCGANVLTW